MKKYLTILALCFTIIVSAQESFNTIHKLVEAKKYREAITKLREFVKTEHKHVSAHYDLAVSYRYLLDELVTIQNANVKNQNIDKWSDKEYQENLAFWKNGINVTDSSIYYYKQTSELMNIKFIELDIRYPELNAATKDCGIIAKVKCARTYLAKEISDLETTNASNKSRLFNVQKEYEAFKSVGKYAGTYNLQMDDTHEAGGDIVIKYSNNQYFAESNLGSAHYMLKHFNISGANISFYLEGDNYYKGTILDNSSGKLEITVESKNDRMKFIKN